MMEKTPVIIRYLICATCILLLLGGCDRSSSKSAGPKVVRKKIVAPQKKRVTVRKVHKTRIAKVAPTAGAQSAAESGRRVATPKPHKPAASTRALLAQKSKPSMAAGSSTAAPPVKASKPAPEPRSKISPLGTPAVKKQPAPSGGKARKTPPAGSKNKPLNSKAKPGLKLSPDGDPPPYDPTGKIDPFEPLFREKPVVAKKLKRKRRVPRTPLERIALSQLKLVGIILASSGNRAMVEESSGKGYIIKKGTYIGTNAGKVVQIKKNKVIVEEEYEDVFGKTKTRKTELKLPKPPGEL